MKRSESAMARRVDDEVVILDIPSGRYFSMNDVGALAWDLLEQGTTTTEIVEAVVSEFEVEPSDAQADVEALIEQLAAAGLIED